MQKLFNVMYRFSQFIHRSANDQNKFDALIAQVIGKQGFVILNAHLFFRRKNADNLLHDCMFKITIILIIHCKHVEL